jgi:hypothetical protein
MKPIRALPLALFLLVGAAAPAARPAPASPAAAVQEDFTGRFRAAMKVGSTDEMNRLVRTNEEKATNWVIDICKGLTEGPSEAPPGGARGAEAELARGLQDVLPRPHRDVLQGDPAGEDGGALQAGEQLRGPEAAFRGGGEERRSGEVRRPRSRVHHGRRRLLRPRRPLLRLDRLHPRGQGLRRAPAQGPGRPAGGPGGLHEEHGGARADRPQGRVLHQHEGPRGRP